MKMPANHYEYIKTLMASKADKIKDHRAFIIKEGKAKDIEMRLRWDVLRATVSSTYICDALYNECGLTDAHVDTALKKIMAEIEPTTV